jgi:hypothetical protein
MEDWKPERKIVAAAAGALLLWVAQVIWPELEIPVGIEGATVTLLAYLIPNPS